MSQPQGPRSQHSELDTSGLPHFDAVVIGAGFAGLHMAYRLRQAGFSVHGFEAGSGVGGAWYWNRYPGARCDSESMYYSYSFLPEIDRDWPLETRYPSQPVLLRYLEFVAQRLDLNPLFTFDARISKMTYDEPRGRWIVRTANGQCATAKYAITAVGGLSTTNVPRYPGCDSFAGEQYHTGNWPHHPVSFAGKRVGVFGTGSSGVQAIPEIAAEAAHLTVFQRTPQYVAPARNDTLDPQFLDLWQANSQELRRRIRRTPTGIPYPTPAYTAMELTHDQQLAVLEEGWRRGGIAFLAGTFRDVLLNIDANTVVADFVRAKIDEVVDDPEIATKLKPTTYPWGTKRVPIGTNYYETFNRANVSLVDIRADPITQIMPSGIRTQSGDHPLDAIVYATGYDALTGSLLALNVRGRNGWELAGQWSNGPTTYMGLMIPDFPNLFTITGPGSPSVLTTVPVATEQHVEWINELLAFVRDEGIETVEAARPAAEAWTQHVAEVADATLYPLAESWYRGANVPGKPRRFLAYVGGLDEYADRCVSIAENGYEGFLFDGVSRATMPRSPT